MLTSANEPLDSQIMTHGIVGVCMQGHTWCRCFDVSDTIDGCCSSMLPQPAHQPETTAVKMLPDAVLSEQLSSVDTRPRLRPLR